jgi:hypothetical protein
MNTYERLNAEMDRMLEASKQTPMAVRLHDVGSLQRAIPRGPITATLADHLAVYFMSVWQSVKHKFTR